MHLPVLVPTYDLEKSHHAETPVVIAPAASGKQVSCVVHVCIPSMQLVPHSLAV